MMTGNHQQKNQKCCSKMEAKRYDRKLRKSQEVLGGIKCTSLREGTIDTDGYSDSNGYLL